MRVAVIGAGIVGVTSAWELARDGHQVTVFERHATVAAEASFAHAGVLAPGFIRPWAAPDVPDRRLRKLLESSTPMRRVGAPPVPALRWPWRGSRAASESTFSSHRDALHHLAHDSDLRLRALVDELRLEHEHADGCLVLLRGQPEVQAARASLKLLAELGIEFQLVDAARCRMIEPALEPQTPLAAGIHLPRAGVGNCRQFAQALKAQSQRLGVVFRFEHRVSAIEPGQPVRVHVADFDQPSGARPGGEFDAVLVCAAMGAATLLDPLGVRLPLQPVHGYSVTANLRELDGYPDLGPRAAVIDAAHQVTISRLGQRVRIAGGAELGGDPDRMNEPALAVLYRVLSDWFASALSPAAQAQVWKGARPMLPDGAPVLGAAPAPGVWLNLGHGDSGWALASGSARVLADLIGGKPAQIDLARFGIERLRG